MRQGAGSSRMLPQLLPRSRFLPHSIILCAAVRVNPVRQLTFRNVCTTISLRKYPEKCFALRRKEYHGRTEEKQNAKKKRSALPIYAIGIVWLLYAGKLNTFRGFFPARSCRRSCMRSCASCCPAKRRTSRRRLPRRSSPSRSRRKRSLNRSRSQSRRKSSRRAAIGHLSGQARHRRYPPAERRDP